MNKITLIGRLTKDPELKYTAGNGNAVASFTLAVDRRFANKDGQREADFIPIVVWGKPAETIANYMSKGKLLAISGRLQVRSYDAKDGTKRYVTEVVAEDFQFLEKASSNGGKEQFGGGNSGDSYHQNNNSGREDDITPVDDGDIPF